MTYPINETLVLRPLEATDGAALLHLFNRNRERLKDFFPLTLKLITDSATAGTYVAARLAETEQKEFFCFVIENADTQLQGLFFMKNVDWRVPKCELAYFIDERLAGQGVMTTAMQALIRHAFDEMGFNRLYLVTMEGNTPSRKLAERCGFKMEGIMKADFRLASGALVNDVLYAIVRPEGK